MPAKSKRKSTAAPASLAVKTPIASSATSALTVEERLHRIETMAKRIEGYVQFMRQIASQNGMSAEVKEKAVIAFYQQMITVEGQLGRIYNELMLE